MTSWNRSFLQLHLTCLKGVLQTFLHLFRICAFIEVLAACNITDMLVLYSIVENIHTAYEYRIVALRVTNRMFVAAGAPTPSFKTVPI